MKIRFRIVDGNIIINNDSLALYNKLMSRYNNAGKELVMEVSEFSKQTTDKQISLFKALILHTVNVTGFTYQEVQDLFIDKFSVPVYDKDIFGNVTMTKKPIEALTNKEFNTLLENSILFVNDFFNADFKTE